MGLPFKTALNRSDVIIFCTFNGCCMKTSWTSDNMTTCYYLHTSIAGNTVEPTDVGRRNKINVFNAALMRLLFLHTSSRLYWLWSTLSFFYTHVLFSNSVIVFLQDWCHLMLHLSPQFTNRTLLLTFTNRYVNVVITSGSWYERGILRN